MTPKTIKIENKNDLLIIWPDNSESKINLKYLRDECPCANCKGETILLKNMRPPRLNLADPKMFVVKSIKQIGNYAINIIWGDGHDTGIYNWEYLKLLEKDQGTGKNHNYKPLI